MFRRYRIAIEWKDRHTVHPQEWMDQLACSVTEPSNWVPPGSTRERGLTFLDQHGKELDSRIFEHQPYFHTSTHRPSLEADEIREFVHASLFRHLQIRPDQVAVSVAEDFTF